MSITRGKWYSLVVLIVIQIAVMATWAIRSKRLEVASPFSPIPLPEGCTLLYKTPQAYFVRCVVKGNWVYLATITARGVTMGQPVRLL